MVLIGAAVGEFADITYIAAGDYDAFGPRHTTSNMLPKGLHEKNDKGVWICQIVAALKEKLLKIKKIRFPWGH